MAEPAQKTKENWSLAEEQGAASLEDLSSAQGVLPVTDLERMRAKWPGNEDDTNTLAEFVEKSRQEQRVTGVSLPVKKFRLDDQL